MARGGKRAQRAKTLQQGSRKSFAQSAGVSRTFQGGKGGGAWQGKGGGSKSQSVDAVVTRPGSGRVITVSLRSSMDLRVRQKDMRAYAKAFPMFSLFLATMEASPPT